MAQVAVKLYKEFDLRKKDVQDERGCKGCVSHRVPHVTTPYTTTLSPLGMQPRGRQTHHSCGATYARRSSSRSGAVAHDLPAGHADDIHRCRDHDRRSKVPQLLSELRLFGRVREAPLPRDAVVRPEDLLIVADRCAEAKHFGDFTRLAECLVPF